MLNLIFIYINFQDSHEVFVNASDYAVLLFLPIKLIYLDWNQGIDFKTRLIIFVTKFITKTSYN